MITDPNLKIDDRDLLLEVIHESLLVRSHFELLLWLQGKVQKFLPHDILISAWGDFSLGLIYFDIVSSHPLLRTKNIAENALTPKIKELFNVWQDNNKIPLVFNVEHGAFSAIPPLKTSSFEFENAFTDIQFNEMKSAVLHGIKDNRGSHDCLYIVMSKTPIPMGTKTMIETFMPFIDCAFRRISQLSNETQHADAAPLDDDLLNTSLTSREIEIMEWVKEGKTNVEIGMILDISIFTVKNHLQHIFKKLNALNRSQAAYKYKLLIK